MTKVLLPKRDRMLLKFSRTNLVESETSSSDSDENKNDLMKNIENKNDLVKLATVGRIKKNLEYFRENKMDENDRNLLKGIFLRKPKDFMEEVLHGELSPYPPALSINGEDPDQAEATVAAF